MSDNYTETDDDFDDEIQTEQNDIKSLRRAASQKKKLEAELEQYKRELAFAKAGIPLDDPKMKYFVKGYDGEYLPDSIREAAIEAGFFQVQQEEQSVDASQEMAAQQRVMAASAGAMPEDVTEEAAYARLQEAMNEGGVEAMLDVARQYGLPTTYDE